MEVIRLREFIPIRPLTPIEKVDRDSFDVKTARGKLREIRRHFRAKRARLMNLANIRREGCD